MHESAVCYAENGETYCNTRLVQEMAAIAGSYLEDYRQAMSELREQKKILHLAWHDHPSYKTFLGVFSSIEKARDRLDADFRDSDSRHLNTEMVIVDEYYNEENE